MFRFRHLVAAVYFARATVELTLEAARKQEITKSPKDLEKFLVAQPPRYHLVVKIRIRDFHRFGVLQRPGLFVGGPIKLRLSGKRGFASIALTAKGLLKRTTKGSVVKE